MKLHLPAVLLVMTISSVNYAVAETCSDIVDGDGALVTSIVKEYGNGATGSGSGYGVSNRENGAPIQSSVITVKDGADMDTVLGGIHIASGADGNNNHHNDQPLIDAGTNTPSIKDGVTINVEGGKVGQILGGNSISSGGEAAVAVLGEKVNVGSITINVTGGEIGMEDTPGEEAIMGGGGRWCGTVDNGGIEVNISGGLIHNTVYAGTNGGSTGYTKLNISGGTINADVYGAGRKDFGVVLGNTEVNVSGGTIKGNVYAAGNQDTVKGNAVVTISGDAEIRGIVYGGGTNGSTVNGTSILNIGTAVAGYTGNLTITDFDKVNIAAESSFSLSTVDDATLDLGDVAVTANMGGMVYFELPENATIDALAFTIVISDQDIQAGAFSGEFANVKCGGMLGLILSGKVSFPGYPAIETTYTYVNEDGMLINVDIEEQSLSYNDGMARFNVSGKVVPEPTTATLSLLALAALAARRRRK